MSVSVNFYQTPKKLNSTKIPTQIVGDFGVVVELKDVTNLYTPTLIISDDLFTDGLGHIQNPMKFVYCYILTDTISFAAGAGSSAGGSVLWR